MARPELTEVDSSNVARLGYDEDAKELWVEFHGGGLYVYEGVPLEVAQEVQNAPSLGRAINQQCRGCYPHRKEA